MNFRSDNESPAHQKMLQAVIDANHGNAHAYGYDRWTSQLDAAFGDLLGADLMVLPLASGTAANAIALAASCPPYGAIFCHAEAHIEADECGAVAQYSGGAQLITLDGAHGKIEPQALKERLSWFGVKGDHEPEAAVVSITQGSECGTVYRPDEIAAIAEVAHGHGMALHMDGARFGNAVATLDCHPGAITHLAGVDIMTFGATKNGALGAEAVVVFNPDYKPGLRRRRMKGGHLLSKMRYVSAQLLAYVDQGLWLDLASRSNAGATRMAAALATAGARLEHPVEINEVFVRLHPNVDRQLREAGFEYHPWPGEPGLFRMVVPWNVSEEHLTRFEDALGCRPRP